MFARQYFMHMGTFCAEACGDSDESWFLVISIFWQSAGFHVAGFLSTQFQ
jgi:hypothetical protein